MIAAMMSLGGHTMGGSLPEWNIRSRAKIFNKMGKNQRQKRKERRARWAAGDKKAFY